MATDRTPEVGVSLYKRAARLVGQGRGSDIALPRAPGQRRDPRLPESPDVLGALRESKRGLSKVREITGRRK